MTDRRLLDVMVIDPQPLLALGLTHLIAGGTQVGSVRAFQTLRNALAALGHGKPDVIVLEWDLPDATPAHALATLHDWAPYVPVLVFSHNEAPRTQCVCSIRAPSSFVHKASSYGSLQLQVAELRAHWVQARRLHEEGLARTVSSAVALSARQVDVLRLVEQGKSNREMARELQVGEETIKTHLRMIFTKLQVKNRTQAVLRFRASHRAGLPHALHTHDGLTVFG